MKNILLIALSMIVVTAAVIFGPDGMSFLFLDESSSEHAIWPGLVMAFAMLLGILSGRLHENISSAKQFKLRKVVAGLADDKELWKSLLASPIIFGVVYSLLSTSNDLIVCTIFSFQNGFFCNIVLKKKQSEMEAQS